MKDLVIGGFTRYGWDQLKNWVLSLKDTGYAGDIILIAFETDQTTIDKLTEHGIEVIPVNKELNYRSKIPIHVERFILMYHNIKNRKYTYVLTADVKDVIFQTNPFYWVEHNLKNKKIVISSESLKYKDEPWGNENLLQTFGKYIYNEFSNKEIFNVGVIAGEYEYVKDLLLQLFVMSINRPIPIVDQATFNFLMHTEPWLSVTKRVRSEDGWACQLGTTMDPSKIDAFRPHLLETEPKVRNGLVFTNKDIKYHIVHQYDRIPSLKKYIDEKYS